ncbi:ADP-ribosylation factor-like protein 2 [Astathelohania contejeani]|uniref:ADP-ribosylation factor-like protein 2 n=1 Tax=Astathelohania contejeani TaxID=164912 RepID=A0ABQ7I286_9MICR|nr:ADP-ribosylation factor-like protein 2 [Thelohania contejeani]
MGLITMIKKIKKERNEMKILTIGLDNAGKTTILHKIFNKPISRIPPTFGYQIYTLNYNSNKDYKITILDVGGQMVFRKYWSNYYENIDGIIFVYDITDKRSFKEYISEIRNEEANENMPLLIFANKIDLCTKEEEERYSKKIKTLGFDSSMTKIIPCSGLRGDNLNEGFDWLIERAIMSSNIRFI